MENAIKLTTNYKDAVKFEAPSTEENTINTKNPNRTWVIHKTPQVGCAQTHKTKILLTLTTININNFQYYEHKEREEPQGTIRGETPQKPQSQLTRTTRETSKLLEQCSR